jgi:hypothetical protein
MSADVPNPDDVELLACALQGISPDATASAYWRDKARAAYIAIAWNYSLNNVAPDQRLRRAAAIIRSCHILPAHRPYTPIHLPWWRVAYDRMWLRLKRARQRMM